MRSLLVVCALIACDPLKAPFRPRPPRAAGVPLCGSLPRVAGAGELLPRLDLDLNDDRQLDYVVARAGTCDELGNCDRDLYVVREAGGARRADVRAGPRALRRRDAGRGGRRDPDHRGCGHRGGLHERGVPGRSPADRATAATGNAQADVVTARQRAVQLHAQDARRVALTLFPQGLSNSRCIFAVRPPFTSRRNAR
jgi:hypothetical protein